jgi:adenylate cyclase
MSMPRVLVVDDDPSMLRCVARLVARGGYIALRADSAKAAMTLIESGQVDILVSDLEMPESDGLALAAWAHDVAPTMPVIIMSGSSTVGTRTQDGEHAFVPKTALPDALYAALENAVSQLERSRRRSGAAPKAEAQDEPISKANS